MKKFLPVLLVLTIFSGFAAAQEADDEMIGLVFGVGAGMGDKLKPAWETPVRIIPYIGYGNSYGPLDLYTGAAYAFTLDKGLPQELRLEEELSYNLNLGTASTLTFTANNRNRFSVLPNQEDPMDRLWGEAEPRITFTRDVDIHEARISAGFPLAYANFSGDTGAQVSARLKAGWLFFFGLGLEASGTLNLSPRWGYRETGLRISFDKPKVLYAEIEIGVDNDFKAFLSPALESYPLRIGGVGPFSFRLEAEGGNIGGGGDMSLVFTVWIKYHL
jgi:hypothetical protein